METALLQEGSLAKTCQLQEKNWDLTAHVAGYGMKCNGLYHMQTLNMLSLKMLGDLQEMDSKQFCDSSMKSGIMLHGKIYKHGNMERRIEGKEYTLLPTPVASDSSCGAVIGKGDSFRKTKNGLLRKVNRNGTDGSIGLARLFKLMIGRELHPIFVEWMMGFPANWTSIE